MLSAVPTSWFFHDQRVSEVDRRQAAYHLAVRIPLATALAEELLFRGVLLALFRQRRSPAAAVLWTSLLFGAWHVLPTVDHYHGNPASALVADPRRGQRLAELATTLSTATAGGAFAWFRLKPEGLVPKRDARPEEGFDLVLANKYYVDEGYDRAIVNPTYQVSRNCLWRFVDNGIIDGFFVYGSAALARAFGWVGSRVQNGAVGTYAWVLVVGVLAVLGAVTLR